MIHKLKILILTNDYTKYDIYNSINMERIINKDIIDNICPITHKLFSNDLFEYDDTNNSINVLHSTIKMCDNIPGVLLLNGNKTFGRYKNKLLYKCIPDDKRLPVFLCPYNIKMKGLTTFVSDKYVTFKYNHWNNKHPICSLTNSLGDVSILNNYYEYQLFCKSLHSSIKPFTKKVSKQLKIRNDTEYIEQIFTEYNVEDRTNTEYNVFSIDPKGSLDYDDAFSIRQLENNEIELSIYIANVPLWMEILNVWDSFTNRISTIYLPDRKRPMLPTILSDCLCSLQQGHKRLSFCMDIKLKNGTIIEITYKNVLVQLKNNYVYESNELVKSSDYKLLYETVNTMSNQYEYLTPIRDSHDVVGYLMILMNHNCSIEMTKYKNGIYRSIQMKELDNNVPKDIDINIKKFIKMWKCASGQYTKYENIQSHCMITHKGLDTYIHITSPIRRLVDLLNIAQLQENLNLVTFGINYRLFTNNWISKLDYINNTMRLIRRVQCDCNLLHMCFNNKEILDQTYSGCIFDSIKRNDYLYQYVVYIPKLNMFNRITSHEKYIDYSMKTFKLYLFEDENHVKKKIRIQLLN